MIIRTGILCIPEWDEQSIDQIRLLLRVQLPQAIVTDEKSAKSQRNWVEEILRHWADEDELSLILTIGGTYPAAGPGTSEIVPEATLAVIERKLPGISESMRAYGLEQTDLALLDRGVAGIRSRSVIINLPGGAASAYLFLEGIVALIPGILAHVHGEPDAPQIEQELEIVAEKVEPELASDGPITSTQVSNGPIEPETSGHISGHFDKGKFTNSDFAPHKKTGSSAGKKKLDPAEFAEFLRRQRED